MEELFSKRLNELITNSSYTLDRIEEYVGKTNATISRYASGEITGVKRSTIAKLAEFFGVSPAWLAGFSDEKYETSETKRIFPLLGTVRAGYNYLASENIIGYITLDRKVSDPENCYALKIKGDSMQPVLYEDDIVVVHKQNDIESGKIGIVIVDNEEATIKKIVKTQDGLELHALNPYYPIRKFSFKDIEKIPVKIIGKVIEGRIYGVFE